ASIGGESHRAREPPQSVAFPELCRETRAGSDPRAGRRITSSPTGRRPRSPGRVRRPAKAILTSHPHIARRRYARPSMAEDSFDLDAAGLRADSGDLAAYVEVLARKLEDALPQQTVVSRRSKGFLSREKVVDTIEVTLGDFRYTLHRGGKCSR